MAKTVILFTDGAYSRSHNVGGYAYLLKYNQHSKIQSGCINNTTSNRMELTAVIKGLEAIIWWLGNLHHEPGWGSGSHEDQN